MKGGTGVAIGCSTGGLCGDTWTFSWIGAEAGEAPTGAGGDVDVSFGVSKG